MMKNKARIIDLSKSVIIALLSISAAALLLLAVGVSPLAFLESIFTDQSGASRPAATLGSEGKLSAAPYVVLITDSEGRHFAAKYDWAAKTRVFSQFSLTLGEAVGSSSNPEIISEAEWQNALQTPGLYLDYIYPQPLTLIASNSGTTVSEGVPTAPVRRLCLTRHGDKLCLHYINEETGIFYRLTTALSSDLFTQRYSELALKDAYFAFESEASPLSELDPYFVFSGESIAMGLVQGSAVPLSAGGKEYSLADFAMNGRSSSYEDSGAVVYVDGTKNLRVDFSGTLIFTSSGAGALPIAGAGDTPTLYESILAAYSIVAATIEPYEGDAEIRLIGAEQVAGAKSYTLTFGYYVNGIPIHLPSKAWCAKFIISSGSIVRAELNYRTYTAQNLVASTATPETSVFPEKQMSIIAARENGSPLLVYSDATGLLGVKWIKIM